MDIHRFHPQAPQRLESKILAAGQASRESLAHLLGIQDAGPPFCITAVAWVDHAIEALMQGEESRTVVFRIERRTEDSAGIVRTPRLVVYYRGDDLPAAVAEAIAKHAPERLSSHSMTTLSELIAADPELGNAGLAMPPSVDQQQRPRSLLDSWGDTDAYADFFAGGEVARAQLDTINFIELFLCVQHSDCECVHVNPHSIAPTTWLVNYPWDDRIRNNRRPPTLTLAPDTFGTPLLSTDLNESDVILGNPAKVKQVLRRGVELSDRYQKSLFFSNTCVPMVIGDDVESEIKRAQSATERPILFLTVSPRSMINVFHDILVTKRLDAEAKKAPHSPRTINLIGFPTRGDVKELTATLASADIDLNITLFPDLDYDLVARLPEAALNVYFPNQTWQHLYDQLLVDTQIPSISPTAPFGISGTQQWLAKVMGALEVDTPVGKVWEQAFGPHASTWTRLVREADQHTLALVVRGEEAHYLTRPTSTWGVPVVTALEEMGFHLHVLLKAPDRTSAQKTAKEIRKAMSFPKRHTMTGFSSLDDLLHRLQDSPAKAVLTAHTFDWRVTQSGKNVFSLQFFEMGISGAIRNAKRLLGVCQTPFYRRFRKYLSRTPEGLRPLPAADEDAHGSV